MYEWLGPAGETLYVGKAKDLKKRLTQYRNATRKKATRKQWDIVGASTSLRFRTVATEHDALLLENELIVKLHPPLNVAQAFEFLYPAIGTRRGQHGFDLVCTTSPDAFPGFQFTGVFRSNAFTREAFDALVSLLGELGHVEPAARVKDVPRVPYSRVVRLRQFATEWDAVVRAYLEGEGKAPLKRLVLGLLEKLGARRRADEVQERLTLLTRFSAEEAEPLRAALGGTPRFVAQAERDRLFLQHREVRAPSPGKASGPGGRGAVE